jgi:hypothetical protein
MSVNVKYGDVVGVFPHLRGVAEKTVLGKAAMFASLEFRALLREVSPIAEEVESLRRELIKQHGKKDDDGNLVVEGDAVKFPDGGLAAFLEDLGALYSKELAVEHTLNQTTLVEASEWLGEVDGNFMDAVYPFLS